VAESLGVFTAGSELTEEWVAGSLAGLEDILEATGIAGKLGAEKQCPQSSHLYCRFETKDPLDLHSGQKAGVEGEVPQSAVDWVF
jgi:hypothetical protein